MKWLVSQSGPAWHAGILDPKGPIAAAERTILLNATSIMLAVVIPVILLTLAFAWWFRAGNRRARHLPDWSYSGSIELVVWSIPALVIMFLGGIAWLGSHDLDPPKALPGPTPPLAVQVVSLDWKWLFIYPEQGVATVNQLFLPAGTPVQFSLTSGSVMNSFFVPQLGSQIYTMARMTTHLNLQADAPGTFHGLSAQFSGEGFADMGFEVVALAPADFAAWIAKTRAAKTELDAAGFARLAQPGISKDPQMFSAVVPGLFETVVKGNDPEPPRQHATHSRN